MRRILKLITSTFVLFFVTIAVTPLASAATPAEQLAQLLSQYKSLSANFTQTIFDGNGTLQQTSSGTMLLLRPDYFRWNTTRPNNQLIVTDGQKLWVYDIDLQQVTIGKLQKATGDTPAMLLTTSSQDLQKNFMVSLQPKLAQANQQVFQLIPNDKNSQFTWVRFFFDNDAIFKMQIKDNIGQMTELRFKQVKANPSLTPSMFKISIPKGVDVVNE